MLLGLSFIVFHINKMNFFSINFSPLKKLIFKEKRIWSWWWLWVPSHIEDYVYFGFFFEVSKLIFSTNFCFPNPFAFIYVQIFVSLIFFFFSSIGHQFRSCFKYVVFDVIVRGGVNRAMVTIASPVLVVAFWGGLRNRCYLF